MKLKRLVALFLSVVAVAGGVSAFTGCKPKDNPDDGNGDTDKVTDGEEGEKDSKEYCQILQTVLTGDYYKNLIDSQQYLHFNSPKFNPAPFKFLEQQGHNMDSIKKGALMCDTYIYFVENNKNNLYMSVKTDNAAGDVTNYVLKYNITNKEYDDLKMLYAGNYIQAPLFIQEMDNQKTPTIESCVSVTYNTYKMLLDYFNTDSKKDIFNSDSIDIDIIKLNANYELAVNARDKNIKDSTNNTHQKREFIATMHPSAGLSYENEVYSLVSVKIYSSNINEFKMNYQTINYFKTIDDKVNVLTIQ